MSDYKEVVGTAVVNVAGDPPNPLEGQLWYNSSTTSFKVVKQSLEDAWATGNNMNTARGYMAGAGTQTAALASGGYPVTAKTEAYN